jgi:hypothetical protein
VGGEVISTTKHHQAEPKREEGWEKKLVQTKDTLKNNSAREILWCSEVEWDGQGQERCGPNTARLDKTPCIDELDLAETDRSTTVGTPLQGSPPSRTWQS